MTERYGVGLCDGFMGMVINNAYYAVSFDTEQEAKKWCEEANKTEMCGTWITRVFKSI